MRGRQISSSVRPLLVLNRSMALRQVEMCSSFYCGVIVIWLQEGRIKFGELGFKCTMSAVKLASQHPDREKSIYHYL